MLFGLRDKYKDGNAVARDEYNDELSLTHSENILFLRRVRHVRTRCRT